MRLGGLCLITCLLLAACVSKPHHDYSLAMQKALFAHTASSRAAFLPYLHQAGLDYPPAHLAILVFKADHRLEVWARDEGPWHYLRAYPILGESGKSGPKLHSGDKQVPEGVYRVVNFNPQSHYDLSMELNYPNSFDRQCALNDHRRNLGDDIFIHGSTKSVGCIAIGNKAINELFPLAYYVGRRHVEVIIAPDDLRMHSVFMAPHHLRWLPQLYARIRQALNPFRQRYSALYAAHRRLESGKKLR